MGRRKIQIEPITDERNRTVTFVKRKAGLFKKAHELSVLCQVDLAVLIIGHNHKIYEYSSNNTNEIIDRISNATKIQESKFPFDFGDYEKTSRISKNPKYLKNSISNVPTNAKHSRKESKNDFKMDIDTTNDDENDDDSDDDSEDDSDDDDDDDDDEDTTENTSIVQSNKRKQGTTPKSTPNKKTKSSSVNNNNSKKSTPLKTIKKESPSSTPIPSNHKRTPSVNGGQHHKRQASNSKRQSNSVTPNINNSTLHAPALSSFPSSSSSIPKFNQQIPSNNALPLPYMPAQHNSILDTTYIPNPLHNQYQQQQHQHMQQQQQQQQQHMHHQLQQQHHQLQQQQQQNQSALPPFIKRSPSISSPLSSQRNFK
ncbi:unnamed protein product [[Candida] boidinii]|nr:unnamed protein product [[Candida] boidinii]